MSKQYKYISNDGLPYVSRVVADRLVYLLPFDDALEDQDEWVIPAVKILKDEVAAGRCLPWYGGNNNYKMSATYLGPDLGRCFVQVGAQKREHQRGGVRIDLNPSKLSARDVAAIHTFLRQILGDRYDRLRTKALLNRLDVAADVVNVLVDDLHVEYKHSQFRTVLTKFIRINCSRVESVRFGSFSSDYSSLVYDKQAELLDKIVKKITKTGYAGGCTSLRQQGITQLKLAWDQPSVTRFEVRCERLGGVRVSELLNLENRFRRFKVWGPETLLDIPEPFQTAFRSVCRDLGVKAAVKLFSEHRQYDELKHRFNSQASWWKPDTLWSIGINHLRNTQLFPKQSFD